MAFHQRFTDLKERLLKGRVPVRPIFLLSFGPMGSGKSTRVRELVEDQGLDYGQFVPLMLDTVIESDPDYQAACERVVAEVSDRVERSEQLQEVYFRFRRDSAVLSEALLSLCVRSRLNLVFESTGSDSSLRWALYMLRRMGEVGYETWIFYPYVIDSLLRERCDARAKRTHRWIPHQVVDECSRMAQANFPILAGHADRVWVVDNNIDMNLPYTVIYRAVNTDSIDHGTDQSRCFARTDRTNRLQLQPPMVRFLKSMKRVAEHEKLGTGGISPVIRLSVCEDRPPNLPGAAHSRVGGPRLPSGLARPPSQHEQQASSAASSDEPRMVSVHLPTARIGRERGSSGSLSSREGQDTGSTAAAAAAATTRSRSSDPAIDPFDEVGDALVAAAAVASGGNASVVDVVQRASDTQSTNQEGAPVAAAAASTTTTAEADAAAAALDVPKDPLGRSATPARCEDGLMCFTTSPGAIMSLASLHETHGRYDVPCDDEDHDHD
jgi:predicted kinase